MTEKLPRYRTSRVFQQDVHKQIRAKTDESRLFVTDQTLTYEELAEIDYLMSHDLEWIKKNLDLDCSDRIPRFDRIAKLPKKDFETLAQRVGDFNATSCRGFFQSPSRNIVICHQSTQNAELGVMNHEMTHLLAAESVAFKTHDNKEGSALFRASGFISTTNTFRYLNECVTELLNLELLTNHKRRDILSEYSAGYPRGVIFLDHLLAHTARFQKQKSKNLRYALYQGYLKGNPKCLKMFQFDDRNTFIRKLAVLKNNTYSATELAALLADIGAPRAPYFEDVERYDDEQPLTLQSSRITIRLFPDKNTYPNLSRNK